MLEITVTRAPNLSEWDAALQRGLEAAMPAVAEALREDADRCFATRTDPWSQPWPATKEPSESSGTLRGSLTAVPTAPTPGVVRATVHAGGAASAYAAIKQFGDHHEPARPYLPLRPGGVVDMPPALRARILELVQASVRAELQRAGVSGGTPST